MIFFNSQKDAETAKIIQYVKEERGLESEIAHEKAH